MVAVSQTTLSNAFSWMNENVRIPIKISLKFVPKGPINNNPALVQIMAWRRSGDKPLSEPMMVRLPTHICVTLPQWVKYSVTQLNLTWDQGHVSVSGTSIRIRLWMINYIRLKKWIVTTHPCHTFNGSLNYPPWTKWQPFRRRYFRCILLNDRFCILKKKKTLKFIPKGPIDNILALVEMMAWCRIGDKLLSEPMLTRLIDAYMRNWGEMSWLNWSWRYSWM